MLRNRAAIVGCTLAVLPLVGCAGTGTTARLQPAAGLAGSEATLAAAGSAPAAVIVFVPGADAALAGSPELWTARDFDVVMPAPGIVPAADGATLARLVAEASAMADAPIWLVGDGPAIDAALGQMRMPAAGQARVSGVVITATSSGVGECRESVFYSEDGTGAAPKVEIRKSGNACPAGSPQGRSPAPAALPASPGGPRLLETSLSPGGAPLVDRVAALIKGATAS